MSVNAQGSIHQLTNQTEPGRKRMRKKHRSSGGYRHPAHGASTPASMRAHDQVPNRMSYRDHSIMYYRQLYGITVVQNKSLTVLCFWIE